MTYKKLQNIDIDINKCSRDQLLKLVLVLDERISDIYDQYERDMNKLVSEEDFAKVYPNGHTLDCKDKRYIV